MRGELVCVDWLEHCLVATSRALLEQGLVQGIDCSVEAASSFGSTLGGGFGVESEVE